MRMSIFDRLRHWFWLWQYRKGEAKYWKEDGTWRE